jgi:hypothetical protein
LEEPGFKHRCRWNNICKRDHLKLGKIYPVRLIDTIGTDLFGEVIKEGEK